MLAQWRGIMQCLQCFYSSKISPQPLKIETSNLVCRFTMTCCIVDLRMGLLLLVFPYICSFFFLSRFFIKDISTIDFKCGIEVRNDKLYCGIANGHSPISSSFPFFPDFCQRYFHNRLRQKLQIWYIGSQ